MTLSWPVVAVSPRESVTLIANCRLPVAVGVPLMTPVLDPIVSGDNEPLATVNVKPVPEPPTAMKAGEVYHTFTRPVGNVGGVMARNPVPLLYPCHRVVDCEGRLHNYEYGIDVKARILEFEGCHTYKR